MSQDEEEWTLEDWFVIKMCAVWIITIILLGIWQLYLEVLWSMWKQGTIDFIEFYMARDQTGVVALVLNTIIITSGLILMLSTMREKWTMSEMDQCALALTQK